MKINKGYIKVKLYDGWAVTPIGEESKKKKIMMTLNDTASEIWDMLADEKSADEIVKALSEKYGISRERAQNGVNKIIDALKNEGIFIE